MPFHSSCCSVLWPFRFFSSHHFPLFPYSDSCTKTFWLVKSQGFSGRCGCWLKLHELVISLRVMVLNNKSPILDVLSRQGIHGNETMLLTKLSQWLDGKQPSKMSKNQKKLEKSQDPTTERLYWATSGSQGFLPWLFSKLISTIYQPSRMTGKNIKMCTIQLSPMYVYNILWNFHIRYVFQIGWDLVLNVVDVLFRM